MSNLVRVIITDDNRMHRKMLKNVFNESSKTKHHFKYHYEIIEEYENGRDLLNSSLLGFCDLLALDIRMPELDGLSALLKLRRDKKFSAPICMVSSEKIANDSPRLQGSMSQQVQNMDHKTKISHIQKVETRILNNETKNGKINDLLSACSTLNLDPILYAETLGANGYLCNPYSTESFMEMIPEVINGKNYISTAHHNKSQLQ